MTSIKKKQYLVLHKEVSHFGIHLDKELYSQVISSIGALWKQWSPTDLEWRDQVRFAYSLLLALSTEQCILVFSTQDGSISGKPSLGSGMKSHFLPQRTHSLACSGGKRCRYNTQTPIPQYQTTLAATQMFSNIVETPSGFRNLLLIAPPGLGDLGLRRVI